MELLAPAGDFSCLEAAIEAGADAVYFGMSLLNARRGAKNFTPSELERAVELARRHRVSTQLTINIDISRRETGAAARLLAMARDIGVNAVIVRDWAVVGLWQVMFDRAEHEGGFCPALHLSTQAAITNPEGARLAGAIGARRVILARELSLVEIHEIAGASDLEIEVFAQGSLCYSISGRCLMSSWGGGRSGNRGLCASPCRVPWAVDGEAVGTAMSMRDLATADRLGEFAAAGVSALKIEGRLKKPGWIREAVGLYRQAIGPREEPAEPRIAAAGQTIEQIKRLAAYAGRETTSAYLDGCFSGLTGVAARKSEQAAAQAIGDFIKTGGHAVAGEEEDGYSLEVTVTEKGISCRCAYAGQSESWRMPKSKIKREKKAVAVEELFRKLEASPVGKTRLTRAYSNEPDFLMPPRNVKSVQASITTFLHRLSGRADDGAEGILKFPLPDEMRSALAAPAPHPGNRRILGERPNQARISAKQLNSTLFQELHGLELIIQNAGLRDMDLAAKFVDSAKITVAFPEVYFPNESAAMRELAEYCRDKGLRAEANCWGSLWLCRKLRLRFVAGPGLPVLNHLAIKCLRDLGAEGATVSMEADKQQIEEICEAASLPLTLLVYARPILAYTRIPKDALLPAGSGQTKPDGIWTDRRGIGLTPESGASITSFRSITAFNWKGISNARIRVANLSLDLSGESRPDEVWDRFTRPGDKKGFLFNYERGLK